MSPRVQRDGQRDERVDIAVSSQGNKDRMHRPQWPPKRKRTGPLLDLARPKNDRQSGCDFPVTQPMLLRPNFMVTFFARIDLLREQTTDPGNWNSRIFVRTSFRSVDIASQGTKREKILPSRSARAVAFTPQVLARSFGIGIGTARQPGRARVRRQRATKKRVQKVDTVADVDPAVV